MTLPQSWVETTFSQITPRDAPIIYGILQPGPDQPSGIPYVRPTEISGGEIDVASVRRTSAAIAEQYHRATLRTDDLILTIVGTIGKVALTPVDLDGGNITQSSCRIRCDPLIIRPGYLRAFLRSPAAVKMYEEKRLGTAVPRLNIADIRQFAIPLPPLEEQRRIVAKLDTLSGRLRRARTDLGRVASLGGGGDKGLALLDRLEAAILARAFRGELVQQDPADEPAAVLLDRVRSGRADAPKAKRVRRAPAALEPA